MAGRVEGKVIIVTGGASNPGLGNATARMLAREGAIVVVTDIDADGAQQCVKDIEADGGRGLALHQDVTDENRWQEVIDETVAAFGRVDVLVNNAGIAILKSIANLTLEDFNRQVTVNLTSIFLGCRHAMAQMQEQGTGGVLINLSSVTALKGMQGCGAYAAAKGGVQAMSRVIAVEGAPDNIRCNTIFPGVIWTNMQAGARLSDSKETEMPPSVVPLGRVGEPDDIAASVLYLASEEASYITGAEFTIDAGMTAS